MEQNNNTKHNGSTELYALLPTVYSDDLNECLQIFEKIRYKSYGFPLIFLDYDYTFKYWSVTFRNPVNFDNPKIKEKTPLKAVHSMFDFLKDIYKNGG